MGLVGSFDIDFPIGGSGGGGGAALTGVGTGLGVTVSSFTAPTEAISTLLLWSVSGLVTVP